MASDEGWTVYQINDRDEIVYVNEEWDRFAAANDGLNVLARKILHCSLWDFIVDLTTTQLYRDLVGRVRRGRNMRFTYRCDSPDVRRLMEMEMIPAAAGAVDFRTRVLSMDPRTPQSILDAKLKRSTELQRVCGWCKKVDVENSWEEVEVAVVKLRLLERVLPPMLTHGICPPCMDRMLAEAMEV